MKLKLNNEIVWGIGLLLSNTVYLFQTLKLPFTFDQGEPGPRFYPFVLCTLMYLFSIILLLNGLKVKGKHTFSFSYKALFKEKYFWSMIVTAIYIALFNTLGYWINTIIYSFLLSILFALGGEKRRGFLVFYFFTSLSITLAVWLIFEIIFGVPLPLGGIWQNV